MFLRISNTPRDYAWGSKVAIADFLGLEPSGAPEAELWLGAHPSNPARIDEEGYSDLAEFIACESESALGQQERLPYLMKILAADTALSLQVHPTTEQAQVGFDRENAAGIPLDAPHRNYKDRFAKPEIIVALSEKFEALCGFREIDQVLQMVAELRHNANELQCASLDFLCGLLAGEEPLRTTVSVLLNGEHRDQVTELTKTVVSLANDVNHSRFADALATVATVATNHPGDPGIVLTLLLNRVTLNRGEALYLRAGNIHAYLSGLGVELMGPSDNVLRGGLTNKHVDVPELLAALDFRAGPIPFLPPRKETANITSYLPQDTGFSLHRVTGIATLPLHGAGIVIGESGELTMREVGESRTVKSGQAFFVTAADQRVEVSGDGALWLATGTPAEIKE
ncbi:mannose-6-phosphate isomerase, class I [Glutamicibacter sp. X7]